MENLTNCDTRYQGIQSTRTNILYLAREFIFAVYSYIRNNGEQHLALEALTKMKELFSAFSAAVFYPLVALVLPGLTALSGWYIYLAQQAPLRGLVSRNHSETAFVLMLLAVFTGTVIDDVGMRIESAWLDAKREQRTSGQHSEEWWGYLRKRFAIEPSGRRHLRRLVARLKFELGIPLGFATTVPALWLNPAISARLGFITALLGLCVSLYLLFEAAATHEVLGKLRHELLKDDAAVYAVLPRKTIQSA